MKVSGSAAALGAVLLLAQGARADVIVVDAAVDGPDLLPVIQAAQDGDTILVKPGAYFGLRIAGKSLTIAGDYTGSVYRVNLYHGAEISQLDAEQTVVLERLWIAGESGDPHLSDIEQTGLYVHDNLGPVRVQSCTIQGGAGLTDPNCGCWEGVPCDGGPGAMAVTNPAGVAFQDCILYGGSSWGAFDCSCEQGGGASSKNGDVGLYAEDTVVAAYDCTILGGGGGAGCDHGGNGGAGAHAKFSTTPTGFMLSGTTIQGGYGGGDPTDWGQCAHGGDGGDGLLVDLGASVWRLDSPLVAGVGFDGTASSGGDGTALVGDVFEFPEPRLELEIPSPVREGESAVATVRGRPGDDVYLFFGTETPFRPLTSWHGVLLTRGPHPWLVGVLGKIPASGVLTAGFQFPDLGRGVTARTWYVQVWRTSAIDGRTLGSMRAVTVLDSAY